MTRHASGDRRVRWMVCTAGTVLLMRVATAPAWAQVVDAPLSAVLPAVGLTPGGGGLREQVERQAAGGGRPTYAPGILVTPSISVDVGATDNAGGLYGNGNGTGNGSNSPDAFVVVTPGIAVSGETSRVQVNAGYTPSITRYLQDGSQNTVYQNLYGSSRITLVPDALFVSANASISEQSLTGGSFYNGAVGATGSGTNNVSLNRNDLTETYNVSVTPYAVHRFGSFGSGQLGYTFAYTANSGNNGTFGNGTGFDANAFNGRYATTQPLITNREFGSFSTGEDFGRLNGTTSLQATQYSSSGVYSGARRNEVAEDIAYALNRVVALVGRIGFEDIRYGGIPPTRIDDALWRVGVRLTPNDNSSILVAYGHSDGIDSAYVSGSYSPTARIRVDVGYSAGLATDLEDLQNASAYSTFDSGGASFNQLTNSPTNSTSSFYGIDNNLFRLRRFTLSASLLYDRDVFALTVAEEQRTIVAAANSLSAPLVGSTDGGPSATLSWDHQLTPVLSSNVSASFGSNQISGAGGGHQNTYSLFSSLSYQLTPTVTTSARYSFQKTTGSDTSLAGGNNGFDSRSGTVNTILFGIRKAF